VQQDSHREEKEEKCPRQKFGIFTQEQMEFAAPSGQGAEHAERQ